VLTDLCGNHFSFSLCVRKCIRRKKLVEMMTIKKEYYRLDVFFRTALLNGSRFVRRKSIYISRH